MNTVSTTLRHDLVALRWLLPLTLGGLVGLQVGYPNAGALSRESELRLLLGLAVALGWFLSLGHMVYNHAPADSSAAWRARPLRGDRVGLSKIGLGLLFFVLVPATLLTAFEVQPNATSTAHPFTVWLSAAGWLFVPFSFLFFLACHCRKGRHLLFAVGILFPLLSILLALVSGRRGILSRLFSNPDALAVTFVILAIGLLALSVRQYHRARTLPHLSFAAGFTAVVLSVASIVAPQGSREVDPGAAKAHLLSATVSIDETTLSAAIRFDGLDEKHLWQLNTWSARPRYPLRTFNDLSKFNLVDSPKLRRELQLEGYELTGTLPTPAPLQFTRLRQPTTPIPGGIDQQKFFFQFQRLEIARLNQMPLRVGGKADLNKSSTVELTTPKSASATIGVSIRFNRAAWADQLTLAPEARLPLLIIADDSHHRARLLEHAQAQWQTTETDDWVELSRDLTLPERWDPASDLRLRLMQVRLSGVMHLIQSLALEP